MPSQPRKKSEWIGAVLVLALLIGGVLLMRYFAGGKQGDDCTEEGSCGFGHVCISTSFGRSTCAATCETDADCDVGRCVAFESRSSLTGARAIHVVGDDHVCLEN